MNANNASTHSFSDEYSGDVRYAPPHLIEICHVTTAWTAGFSLLFAMMLMIDLLLSANRGLIRAGGSLFAYRQPGGVNHTPSRFCMHNIKFSRFRTHKIKNFLFSGTKKDPEAFGLWISNIS